jgi:curli production assembly/transport component CsgG
MYRLIIISLSFLLLTGCATTLEGVMETGKRATLTPRTATYVDLVALPEPKGKILVSVYNFRDQSGQYKRQTNVSSFSTAVTQGATSILLQTLKDSKWFIPVEREGLQNLLTERKIIRAALKRQNQDPDKILPPLSQAQILLEGGIIGYESNIATGGDGARYFGIGASRQYRIDQVSIYLRAIDIRTGRILNTVSTTKSILSREVTAGVFKYVSYKRLLEIETGYTTNEPGTMCVQEAIEKAVLSLIVDGLLDKNWALKNNKDMKSPVISAYLEEKKERVIELN